MSEMLQQKHGQDWQRFKKTVLELTEELKRGKTNLAVEELTALDDIGDALEAECASLFNRISGRL